MYFVLKLVITAFVVAAVSEVARRYSMAAAALASLPLTSILAMLWLYRDTQDVQKIIDLSYGIAWLVLPSVLFFIALPWLLQHGMKFYPAMLVACLAMSASYALFLLIKAKI
jgi:hypothetical protein